MRQNFSQESEISMCTVAFRTLTVETGKFNGFHEDEMLFVLIL